MTSLFEPVALGGLSLASRIVMAPMTRTRANSDGVPNDLMREYYVQRASAGLIVTECTKISEQGHGIINAPGIYNDAQVAGWKAITDAVHAAGGKIALQIWHCGRASHPAIRGGDLPVAPSPIAAAGEFYTPEGPVQFPVPRELTIDEIGAIIEDFRAGARNALAAGFDGIELHGAFGYLPDQFLQSATNQRQDAYGGSVANRARFMIEVADALASVWGADRVGVKLSPSNRFYGMFDDNADETFGYVIDALNEAGVAYIHLMEPNAGDLQSGTVQIEKPTEHFRGRIKGALISNGGYDRARAEDALSRGVCDAVSFGVPFIANPDLPARLAADAPLSMPDPASFYGFGPQGYVDYAPMAQSSER
jgi:N-ethylmaleimide reductase